jgi:hypothetical protein
VRLVPSIVKNLIQRHNGTSNAFENFSRVSRLGTVWPFSTRLT